MTVHGGASEEQRWSDLPGDLLGAIYVRSASAYDRARFAVVCSAWRAAAAWHPRLPALPLLLPSTGDGRRDRDVRVYSLEDGRALRVPLPWFPWGNRLVGYYDGGWIATVSSSDELLVVNLFSGARAALTKIGISSRKIVFSKDPSSSDCVMAVMTTRSIALRRVGFPGSGWTTWWYDLDREPVDITFCNGELCGVTSSGDLIVLKLGMDKGGTLVITRDIRVNIETTILHTTSEVSSIIKYIFELKGKLAIAVEVGPREYNCKKGHFFRVFELAKNDDTTTTHQYTWTEVMSLGDYALFLGPAGCKAVHVSACQRGGVEGNRIYYSKQHTYLHNNVECLERLDMSSCTVHCWGSEGVHHLERIVSRGYHYREDQHDVNGCNGCVWLWPPDF